MFIGNRHACIQHNRGTLDDVPYVCLSVCWRSDGVLLLVGFLADRGGLEACLALGVGVPLAFVADVRDVLLDIGM